MGEDCQMKKLPPCYPRLIIELLGYTARSLSCATGVHRTQISRVLHGDDRYPGTRKKIATELALSVEEIFEKGAATLAGLAAKQKEAAA